MNPQIVKRIRIARMQRDMFTDAKLAQALGVHPVHLSNMLTGRAFSVRLGKKMAALLNLPEDELVAWQRDGRDRARAALKSARDLPPAPDPSVSSVVKPDPQSSEVST